MQNFVVSKSGVKVYKDYRDNVTIDKDNPVLRNKAQYPREKYNRRSEEHTSELQSH